MRIWLEGKCETVAFKIPFPNGLAEVLFSPNGSPAATT